MFTTILPLVALIFSGLIHTASAADANTDNPELRQAVILQYHHISDTTPPSTSLSPTKFVEHLELVESLGFQVLPLDQVINTLRNGESFQKKTLAITFDDGYDSIYTHGFPELKKRDWPFTVFINPQAIDEKHGSTMTWAHLKEMQENGALIANHSYSHLHLLKKETDESKEDWLKRIEQDTLFAQSRLEKELNIKHQYYAYPYGEFNEDVKQLLKDMGYIGFSQQSGAINATSDFLSLSRFPAAGIYANTETLTTKLNSFAFDIVETKPQQVLRHIDDQAPELQLTINQKGVRYKQAQCFYQGKPIKTNAELNGELVTIKARFEGPLNLGRSRYNCTAPSTSNQRYFWYSMPFITTNDDNHWVD